MLHHKVDKDEIGDRVYLNSGRETELVIARESDKAQSAVLNKDAFGQLAAEIRGREVDVLVIDPLVAAHRVNENDNMAMELVAKSFARIAEEANCAVMLVHHAKKTYGEDVRTDDVRGASALAAAVRDVRMLNVMSGQDAEKARFP
jgi:RecA-family ATPase